MMNQLPRVAALLFLIVLIQNFASSQLNGPVFLECYLDSTYSWCNSDDGVRLPDNNRIYLGENNPDATSCSVHLNRKLKVSAHCSTSLEYEVLLFMNDTSQGIVLQPSTNILTDSIGVAELVFNSALSPKNEIQQNGIPYSACQPYRLKWIVRDSCGNESICEERFELFDCNQPFFTLGTYPFLIRTNLAGNLFISVDTIVQELFDDCNEANDFLFSLQEHFYQPDTLIFICDVPAQGVEVPWSFWIADKGNDLDCDGTITWAERRKTLYQFNMVFVDYYGFKCGEDWRTLSGNIKTYNEVSIAKAEVSIYDQGVLIASQITGPDGKYLFGPESMLPENYVIKVRRNDYHKNGVSTSDVILLMKHLLGTRPIDNPYKIIASDVNSSIHLSAIDLIEMRKVILGIYSEFPNSPSWKFVPADFALDIQNSLAFPREVHVVNAPNDHHQDFIGVKIGDLNGTVNPY